MKELKTASLKPLNKIENEKMLSNVLQCTNLMPKPENAKRTTKENCEPISTMNITENAPNKYIKTH